MASPSRATAARSDTKARPWSASVYIAELDKLHAMCDQWFHGPKGERVSIDRSCQRWLPVSFDPAAGVAKMLHVEQWDPWKR